MGQSVNRVEEFALQEEILALIKKLVSIPSVSGTAGENVVARAMEDWLRAVPYFVEHPEFVLSLPVEEGGLERRAVLAFLPAGKPTERTVLLTGHHDVVDTDVCGDLADLAYDADAYTAALADRVLPEDARRDLDSGNYLFGRGVMDMKGGLALHMCFVRHMSEQRDNLGVNLLFLSVPDEEANSTGMRGSLPALAAFVREHGLRLVAALTGEPTFPIMASEEDSGENGPDEDRTSASTLQRMYYTGTTGKMMPFFFCIGREAHAGCYYDGVNGAAIAARVTVLMDGNPNFIDAIRSPETGKREALSPPCCLGLKDLRGVYSVTLPERAIVYCNVLNMVRTPTQVLEQCRQVAQQALDETLVSLRRSGERTRELAGLTGNPVPDWTARVYSFAELQKLAALAAGDGVADPACFLESLPSETDARVSGLSLVDHLVSLAHLKGPAIVVGFLPPYYPAKINLRRDGDEMRLRRILEEVCADAERMVGNIRLVECFGGITDLSFLGFQGRREDLDSITGNMPGWGKLYDLSIDDLVALDAPVANMGPSGKDAHKDTERLELEYSLRIAPQLLASTIRKLSDR